MLTAFSVSNFRGFENKVELRLDKASDYQFNTHLIAGDIVKNGIIYGKNGSGKTSLLRAMANIVPVLTDNFCSPTLVSNMDCGNSNLDPKGPALFEYTLLDDGEEVRYVFAANRFGLLYERVYSDGRIVLDTSDGKVTIDPTFFPELEGGDWIHYYDGKNSVVKFLVRSGIKLEKKTLNKIIAFAEGFLMIRSVIDGNEFAGLLPRIESMVKVLENEKNLREFEDFLRKNGIDYSLEVNATQNPQQPALEVKFAKENRSFFDVASSGTRFFLLVFYWAKKIENKVQFLCVDEFDAYYHDDCAVNVFKLLSGKNYQTLFTTHRTSLMSTSVTRPDTLFTLEDGEIHSFAEAAKGRELREAHNIEKMYRAGAFDAK